MPPFEMLVDEARLWLCEHPADFYRMLGCLRTVEVTVGKTTHKLYEDDAAKLFGRSPWTIGDADMHRWRAACVAVRRIMLEGSR